MRSRIPLLIVVVALLILGLLVFFGILRRVREIEAGLPRIIESQMQTSLNRQVSIGSMRVISLRTAIITDLTINDRSEFGQKAFFAVPRAVVTFDSIRILRGRPIATSIWSVTLINPRMTFVRNAGNAWNIEDLIRRPPSPPAARFRGRVEIRSAEVTVVDYRAKIRKLPESNTLNNVSGSLDFTPTHSFNVNLSGRGEPGRLRDFRAKGRWAVDRPITNLNLNIREASARYWMDYFSNISIWTFNRGTFDSQATLFQDQGKAVRARGTARLRNSSVASPYLRTAITPFAANAGFVGTNIRVAGTGLLGRSPVGVEGRIIGLFPSALDLRVASNRMDFKTLQSAIKALPMTPYIRWTAPGTVTASITGPAKNPMVAGTATMPGAVVYGAQARAIDARAYYRNGTINITRIIGRAADGSFQSKGTIALRPLHIRLIGSGRSMSLAALPLPGKDRAAGIANARFSLDYLRGQPVVRLSADVSRSRIAGTPIESANAQMEIRNRRILVQESLVHAVRGTIAAKGEVTFDGGLDLGLTARDIDLLTLLRPLGYTQFTGTANFDGTVTGSTRSPLLTGRVAARNGELRGIKYDLATGRLIATNTSLTLQDAVIRQVQTEIATTGTIVVQRKTPPTLALQVRTTRVSLSQLTALLNIPLKVQGTASANLRLQGTYPNLQISGEITAVNGVVAGLSFDSAVLEVETVDGRTVIRQLSAVRGASRLTGSGFVGPRGMVEVNLTGENLDLNLLNDALYPYAILQGPATFSAQVRGTISRPMLTGTLQSVNPIVNRRQFESFAAGVSWDGARLTISDATLSGQGTTWRLPLVAFTPQTASLEFQGSVESGSIARIVDILRNSPILGLPQGTKLREFLAASPTPFSGALDGAIRLEGRLGHLDGDASITATAVQMGSQVVDKVELQLVVEQSVLLLRRVAVTSPGVSLAATAEFVQAKPTELAAGIKDTQLANLLEVIRSATFLSALPYGRDIYKTAKSLRPAISGSLDATVSMTNIQTGFTGSLSLGGTGITVSDQPLGDLTASARLANGSVIVDQFAVAGSSGQASLTGTVNPEGRISFSGIGTRLSLAALRPFTTDKTLAGTADFGFSASGTMENPSAQLSFDATNVIMRRVSFDRITAERLTIADDRIASGRVEVRKDSSTLVLSGSLPFSLSPPIIPTDQPITITADLTDQSLALAKSLTGLVENASGSLIANIQVSGTVEKPIINGPITLADGSLKVKGFENSLTGVTAQARFVDSALTLDSLQGASSLGGTFTGNGTITMTTLRNGMVNLFLNANTLRLSMAGVGGKGGSAVFTTTGQLAVVDTIRSPVVQGTVVVSDARVVIPANLVPTSIVLPALPISPQLAVTLNLANNVIVERGGLRARVVGPVTIAGTMTDPIVSGTVQIASGRLRYPARTLELRPGGTASFLFQPPEPAVISIDVEAVTRLSAISPLTARVTRYTVTLDITGPIGDLSIDVRTSPPGLSELDALATIFGGSALEALLRGSPLGSVFQDQLGQVLLGLALPGLFQPIEIGGITLAIESGFEVPLLLSASAQLTDRLVLSYSRSVAGRSPVDTFGFSYMLSPKLAVTIQFEGLNGVAQEATTLLEYYKRF